MDALSLFMMSPLFTYVVSFAVKLCLAILAIVVGRALLKQMDKWSGFNFKEWINHAPPDSVAFYLGCRILGMFLVMAFIFG